MIAGLRVVAARLAAAVRFRYEMGEPVRGQARIFRIFHENYGGMYGWRYVHQLIFYLDTEAVYACTSPSQDQKGEVGDAVEIQYNPKREIVEILGPVGWPG